MSEMTIYQRSGEPLQMMQLLGSAIAKSQIFGCENESQGIVIAASCMARGIDPLSFAESHHLIKGKLSMKADRMLAKFNEIGGSHKMISRTADMACIELSYKETSYSFSLTWEEAQREPFVYEGKESDNAAMLAAGKKPAKIKAKYLTPRSRTQMMWARVVSDGVRSVAPQVCAGTYTPEEADDFGGDVQAVQPVKPVVQSVEVSQVVDAEYTVTTATEVAPFEPDNGKATGPQIAKITELFKLLQVPGDAQLAAIQKRGARDMGDLSQEGAADLIAGLQRKIDAAVEAPSQADPAATTGHHDGPCTETQVEQVRELLKQIAQTDGEAIPNRYKAHLASQGIKTADLTMKECEQLIKDLEKKNLEVFFSMVLANGKPAKN